MHCKYLPLIVPYKALEKFSKALYGTTGSTYSARVFRPVMIRSSENQTDGVGSRTLILLMTPSLTIK